MQKIQRMNNTGLGVNQGLLIQYFPRLRVRAGNKKHPPLSKHVVQNL